MKPPARRVGRAAVRAESAAASTYEPKPPYVYRGIIKDDPRGEKYGAKVEHHVVDRDGALEAIFQKESAARYWARAMNEFHGENER